MALNFPDSPILNQVYTDTTSGFSYQWDGVVWKSYSPSSPSEINVLDDISGSFNGSTQTFSLTISSIAHTPGNAQQLRVVLGGVVQEPGVDYTVSGSDITFTTPPSALLDCSIVSLGPAVPVNIIDDGSVTPAKLSTGGPSWNASGDLSVSGNVSIAGTLTYETVTDVDSVGLITARDGLIANTGTATTALIVNGDARVTGILTIGTSSITLDGDNNTINVGSGVTITSTEINVGSDITISSGIVSAITFYGDGSNMTNTGVGTNGSINTTGIITASKLVGSEFIGIGDKLIFSPIITTFSPVDGATGVSALSSPNIVLTYGYDPTIGLGTTGTITLRTGSASGSIVESFSVGVSTRITLVNQTLTIDPTNNFDYDTQYYTVLPVGVVTNYLGNSALLDTYSFTTEVGPVITSFSPTSGATDIAVDTNIVLTFDKNIRAGSGTITLRSDSSTGTIIESYDVTSSARLTFSTNTLTIDPTSDLSIGTNYYVVVPDEAVAGYAGTDTYNFTTINVVNVSSYSPTNGATNQSVSTNISLTFDNTPSRGTGTITLRSGSAGGTIIESYDAATSPRISIAGNIWTLDPTSDLPKGTSIYLVIPNTAITPNYEGLNIGGGTASYSFTTVNPSLGDAYEGGYLICQSGGVRWVVSPSSSEVSRNWYSRNDSNTRAQQVSGCTGWFVPTNGQLQNPGYTCRTYWDSFSSYGHWSSTEINATCAWNVNMISGGLGLVDKSVSFCVRSFRCVTY